MVDSKLGLVVVLGGKVNVPFPMDLIQFLEQGGVCSLKIHKEQSQTCVAFVTFHLYELPGG